MKSFTRRTDTTTSSIVLLNRLGHLLDAGADALYRGVDQGLDLLGGCGGALRQRTHLAGDDGEALALLAGPRRLDRGVEGEDVGLEGDAVDGLDDVGDPTGTGFDLLHRAVDPPHHLAALFGHRGGSGGQLAGLARRLGVLLHGGGELLHRGRRLLEVGGLRLGADGEIGIAGGDLAGRGQDGLRRGLDALGDPGELIRGAVGVPRQAPESARQRLVGAGDEVAGGEGVEHRAHGTQTILGGLHQPIQAIDHFAEGVLERGGIATRAEVAGSSRGDESVDLAVDRHEVRLRRGHGGRDPRLLPGQLLHVLGEIAAGITPHDAEGAIERGDMAVDDGIDRTRHVAEAARQAVGVDPIVHLAGLVLLRHLELGIDHRTQTQLHASQVAEQAIGLQPDADFAEQVTLGDAPDRRCRNGGLAAELAKHGPNDEPGRAEAEHDPEGHQYRKQTERRIVTGFGILELLLGHAQLKVDQLVDLAADRVNALVQGAIKGVELPGDPARHRREGLLYGVDLAVGGGQQILAFLNQGGLLRRQRGGDISLPFAGDDALCVLDVPQGLLRRQQASVRLVDRVDHVYRVGVRDLAQAFERHDPVEVDGLQPFLRPLQGHQAVYSDNDEQHDGNGEAREQ
jgi:hypothetical protein